MSRTADRQNLNLPRDRCDPRRSPTKLRDSELPVPNNTSKKGCDNDDTAAKGFPRYTARREEGKPRRPLGRSEGTLRRHRVSVGQANRDFSRSHPPPQALRSSPPNRPPPCANPNMKLPTLSHHGTAKHGLHSEEEEPGLGQQHRRHAGGPHLHRR